MRIYWYTTDRTKDIFLKRLKETLTIIEHSEIKEKYSNNKIIKLIQMGNFFKKKCITHIIVDGFSIEVLLVSIIARYLNICVVVRVRGGMNNEFLDDFRDLNPITRNIKNIYFSQVRNFILRKANKIITVSVFGKAQILYELPFIPSEKIDSVTEPTIKRQIKGIDKAKITKLLEHNKIITTVTSFRYFRKYDAVIHYHKSVLKVLHDNPQWSWIIAGDGKGLRQVKKVLFDSAHAFGVEKQIKFLGFVEDIPLLLSQTDIFFYPTFRDTAAQALKEGEIFGLPVLINRSSCGPLEFIPPCADCQKEIFEESYELEAAMQKLIDSEIYRKKLGKLNQDFAFKNYNIETISNKFIRLLKQSQ